MCVEWQCDCDNLPRKTSPCFSGSGYVKSDGGQLWAAVENNLLVLLSIGFNANFSVQNVQCKCDAKAIVL